MSESERLHQQSRDYLVSHSNPSPALDYVATFSGKISKSNENAVDGTGQPVTINIQVRYVPDKLVVAMDEIPDYFEALAVKADDPLELLAAIILDDLNNELIPRWLNITASLDENAGPVRHSVTFEDRQPNWDNPALLARLAAI